MRLLFWSSVLCFILITAGKLVAAGRATRSLAFRKGSSFFVMGWYQVRGRVGCISSHFARTGRIMQPAMIQCTYEQVQRGIDDTAAARALCAPPNYRVNYKITSFRYTTIFAHAAGFKLVWELPSGVVRTKRSISDVHEAAELVYDSHGFDGRSCLLKNVCQAMEYVRQRDGVMAKILKLLIGSYTDKGDSPEDTVYCDVHVKNCPLELIGIDSFIE